MLEPIQMLWVGPRIHRLQQICIQSFLDVGHPVYLYAYNDIVGMPDNVDIYDANEIIPASEIFTYQRGSGRGSYAAFANLFRYKLIFDRGSWWSDTDVFCVKPWAFKREYVFSEEPAHAGFIHNGIIKAPAGCIEMDYLYRTAAASDPSRLTWGQTGSILMTRAMKKYPNIMTNAEPPVTFCPISWSHVVKTLTKPPTTLAKETVGVHLFQEMWRRRNADRDVHYPIYDWLKERQVRGKEDLA